MIKVRLTKDARINHKAGEIIMVSPEQYNFLVSVGAAVYEAEKPAEAEKPKRGAKKKA